MWVRVPPLPPETSESERWEEARAEGAGVDKRARREATKLLRKLCYENGLIVEVGGYYNNVIRFLPSLTLTKEIAENGLRIFADANKAMEDSIALLDKQR